MKPLTWIQTKQQRIDKLHGALNEAFGKLDIAEVDNIIAKVYSIHGLGKQHFKAIGEQTEKQIKQQHKAKEQKQKEAKKRLEKEKEPLTAIPKAWKLRRAYPDKLKEAERNFSKKDFERAYLAALNHEITIGDENEHQRFLMWCIGNYEMKK